MKKEPARVARLMLRKEAGCNDAYKTHAGYREVVPEVGQCKGLFELVETKMEALPKGVPVECGEGKVNGGKAGTVNNHHLAALIRRTRKLQ